MNTNPANLAIRFLLEIVMLIILGCWGWHLTEPWIRYIAAPGLPLIAAVLWGIFLIPNDPKPAPVAIPGILRLLLELGLFGLSAWPLYDLGYSKSAIIMTIIVILHYIVSYDRAWAMLRNKPYNGFVK
ncbi:YrdB family protein [Mucilaginibacter sp. McL0603]|uniref:YrdB family protein n=1 Tax=Mucilaginibacter sp. McL0603 TaxID=3415670 RepID=UPI003CF9FE69